jgi:hypothetical protein
MLRVAPQGKSARGEPARREVDGNDLVLGTMNLTGAGNSRPESALRLEIPDRNRARGLGTSKKGPAAHPLPAR